MTQIGDRRKTPPRQVYSPSEAVDNKPPLAFTAIRLNECLKRSDASLCFVALSENSAEAIAEAIRHLFPQIDLVVLPPWDCLPYDRVAPSRRSMGRRMDALRVWLSQPAGRPRLLLTSLDAILQRLPPAGVIEGSQLELVVGEVFDRSAFENFIRRTGYEEEAVADDPGEVAMREEVIDIFPAGALSPMRILLSDDGTIEELRTYDPASQRTVSKLKSMVLGPASELVLESYPSQVEANSARIERSMVRLYGVMPTVFDLLGDIPIFLAPGAEDRAQKYVDFIDEACEAHHAFGEPDFQAKRSLYLNIDEWRRGSRNSKVLDLDPREVGSLPQAPAGKSGAMLGLVKKWRDDGYRVVIAGDGREADGLCRRIQTATGDRARPVHAWEDVVEASSGDLLRLNTSLRTGFVHEPTKTVLLTVAGDAADPTSAETLFLGEPELRVGDVVVHEDHGVGILRSLDSIAVDGETRHTARLEYRDGASVLVPMEDFDKLWRYGSEPEAISVDRLHADSWAKKKEQVANDIRLAARHLVKAARQRRASTAACFVPPTAAYDAFVRRFPYTETPDQTRAVEAVLSDLASGTVMNRIICGDVGFGKTEVALRAAAAVALAGGQVAVIAPTTVLVRQHFTTFQRRFKGTEIKVGMLSRLSKTSDSKEVKAGLSSGGISIVVATQAVLAKDVAFSRFALLVVDEEHRFGIREKRAMSRLGHSVHTLAMSATPIPRTLQTALIGLQDVNLLQTPPNKRRPVRTTLAPFDRASLRVALLRESRRGGQSFVVVPRIDDMAEVEAILRQTVPELVIRIAHGKMPAAGIDDAVVGFANGDGDILLSTNIIESGLDVPRANTILIWRAEMFGLAQLHQLRGRVGRGRAQGLAYCITGESDLSEGARQRLATLVENDRLGSGLAISIRDLDLRGGGDILGEDQAGHMKMIGIGLYQKMLEQAVALLSGRKSQNLRRATTILGAAGTIPDDYISDPAVRLNLYARVLRASSVADIVGLVEEFEDRFGELPEETEILLRTTKLQITAARLGVKELVAGPKALSVTISARTPKKIIRALDHKADATRCDDRFISNAATGSVADRLLFFDELFGSVPHK